MKGSRREFLMLLTGAASVPRMVGASGGASRLPLAFSTLGCPTWDWHTILNRAKNYGYSAIELRGLLNELDVTKCRDFSKDQISARIADLSAVGLHVCCLGSSARLHESDSANRIAQLDEARRFIDLAQALGTPFVRVFGDQFPQGDSQESVIDRVTAGLNELAQHAKGSDVIVLIESHGDFCRSSVLLKILKGVDANRVGLLWDVHHTIVSGKEQPSDTFQALGRYIKHVHLKDSKPLGDTRSYVLTGHGTLPLKETVQMLDRNGYQGLYSFEWEKRWHPDLPPPEVALPHFVEVLSQYLAAA